MTTEIESKLAESIDDIISGEFCSSCLHEFHPDGKCYELDFNGTVYSACRCEESKSDVNIRVSYNDSDQSKKKSIKRGF